MKNAINSTTNIKTASRKINAPKSVLPLVPEAILYLIGIGPKMES